MKQQKNTEKGFKKELNLKMMKPPSLLISIKKHKFSKDDHIQVSYTNMKLSIFITTLFLCLFSLSSAEEDPLGAKEAFDKYLADCPKNEIRCLWFLGGSDRVGMKMSVNMTEYRVSTVRDVHNWAHQNSETRKLSHYQVDTLKQLIKAMPDSVVSKARLDLVFLSYWNRGKLEQRAYLRHDLPRQMQRLYDIGGGYIDTTKTKPPASKE